MRILIIIFFFLFQGAHAQCTFENIYYPYVPILGQPSKTIATSDGGNISVGSSNYDSTRADGGAGIGGDMDMIVIKTDSCGKTLWRTHYGYPTEGDDGVDVIEAGNGDYMVLGNAYWQQAISNVRVVRFTAAGEIRWSKLYSGSLTSHGFAMIKRPKNNSYIICGLTDHMLGPHDLYGGYLLEINDSGTVLKSKEILGYDSIFEIKNIFAVNDTSYLMVVLTSKNDSILLFETDTSFNVRWKRNLFAKSLNGITCYNSCLSFDKKSIVLLMQGVAYITPSRVWGGVLTRFNLQGDSVIFNFFADTSWTPQTIIAKPDNGFIIGNDNSVLFDTDSNLNYISHQTLNKNTFICSFAMNSDKSITVSGYSYQANITYGSIDVLKMDSNGNYLHSHAGVDEAQFQNTDLSIYPNPATNELHIQTASSEKLNVQIFDITGKQIISTILFTNTTSINTSSLNEGLYFVRITDANGAVVKTQKVAVVR